MTAERRREMMMSRESHTMAPPTHLISMIQVKERTQAPGTSWWRTERERERERASPDRERQMTHQDWVRSLSKLSRTFLTDITSASLSLAWMSAVSRVSTKV